MTGVPEEASESESQSASERERGYIKSTLRHGGIYTLGMVLSRLVGFVMIPVYTRVLSPADYGVLEILSLTTDILSMLAGMGIGLAVMRFYYRAADQGERRVVVSSAALLLAAVFVAVSSLGLIAAGPLTTLLLGDGASVRLARMLSARWQAMHREPGAGM